MENDKASERNVITPTCGDLLLQDFAVRRGDRFIAVI